MEDLLGNVVIPETAFPIHAQGCGIRRFLRQIQPTGPFICHVIVDLFLQPPLRTDAVEIPHKQHAEQHLRLKGRAAQVGAVQRCAQPANERKVDAPVDFPQQMVLWYQLFQDDQFLPCCFSWLLFSMSLSPVFFPFAFLYSTCFSVFPHIN